MVLLPGLHRPTPTAVPVAAATTIIPEFLDFQFLREWQTAKVKNFM